MSGSDQTCRQRESCGRNDQNGYFFLASRRTGDSARVKSTTSSPVTVLISWCRLKHLDAGDLLDHRFHDRTGRFDQMGPHLLEQVPSLLGRKRLDQLLLGGGQNALQADHEKIAQQVGVNILGTPAHIVLLEARNSLHKRRLRFLPGFSSRPPHNAGEQRLALLDRMRLIRLSTAIPMINHNKFGRKGKSPIAFAPCRHIMRVSERVAAH